MSSQGATVGVGQRRGGFIGCRRSVARDAFQSTDALPGRTTVHTTPVGPRLRAWPLRELAGLVDRTTTWSDLALPPGTNPLARLDGELWDLSASLELGEAQAIVVEVRGTTVRYDVAAGVLHVGDRQTPLPARDSRLGLRLLIDRTTIEAFGDGGFVYLPVAAPLADGPRTLGLTAEGGAARIVRLEVRALRSIWRD